LASENEKLQTSQFSLTENPRLDTMPTDLCEENRMPSRTIIAVAAFRSAYAYASGLWRVFP